MYQVKLSPAASYSIAFSLIIGFQAILLAYVPIYFTHLGYTPFEVSLVSGLENIAGMLGPAILVARSYPSGLGLTILSGISGALMLLVSPLFGTLFLTVMWGVSLFLNRGVFALVNDGAHLQEGEGNLVYSESRSWGSASFLLVMYGLGLAISRFGVECIMPIGAVILISLALVGLNIRDQITVQPHKSVISFFREYCSAWHYIFYISLLLIWASHGPAYTYLSLHLVNLGWSPEQIGLVWNVAVLSEIVIFLIFKRIEKFFSLETYLIISQVACVARWLIMSLTVNPTILVISQILHALTFGLCFVVSQKLLIKNVTDEYRKSAFAVYFTITLGLGSLLGKFFAGLSTTSSSFNGDFSQSFFIGSILALLSLIIWSGRRFAVTKA